MAREQWVLLKSWQDIDQFEGSMMSYATGARGFRELVRD